MRIALINQYYTPDISPTAHLTASLAEGLAAVGHQVTVVTSRGGYVEASQVATGSGENPRVHRAWTPRLGKATVLKRCIDYGSFYLQATWQMLRLPRQDVIVSLTTPPYIAWAGYFHCLLHRGTKLILWNMDCYPDVAERAGVIKKGSLLSRIMRAMNRALFRRLDHLICLDQAMVDLLIGQYGSERYPLPTTIIPNWERASLFPQADGDRASPMWEEAPALGLLDQFVVLYLGNAGVGHPFETVIEAAKQHKEENVRFVFVGGGKRWAWLEDAKEREGLSNLLLHGYVQKELTSSVMMAADCALITLGEEMAGVMSPSKLHSNLAMGLPVIYVGPEGSNVDEAIKRFGCGASLRQGDVEGVVRFIRENRQDAARLDELQTKARQAFEAAYCDEQTLPQFERVLAGTSPSSSEERRHG